MNIRSRLGFGLASVALATAAFAAMPAVAYAQIPSPKASLCRVVTTPPKYPWYLCLNLTGSTTFQRDNPGCFPTKRIVC